MMWRWYMPRPARTHIAFIPIFIHQGTWMINILIFMHFFTHFLFCNWIEINQVVISYLAAIDTDDRMMTVHGVDRRVAGTLFWSITDLVGNSWSPTIVTDCRSIVPRGNKNLPIYHNFLGDGTSFQRQTLWHWFSSLEFWRKKKLLYENRRECNPWHFVSTWEIFCANLNIKRSECLKVYFLLIWHLIQILYSGFSLLSSEIYSVYKVPHVILY